MKNQFISREEHDFPIMIGRTLASALAGFVAGSIFTSIVWYVAFYLASQYRVL